MRLVRKSSKLALTSMVIAGMMLSSCSGEIGSSISSSSGGSGSGSGLVHKITHGAHKAWDWVTGKPPKWQREQAAKNAEAVANWPQTLSNVNIKGLHKELLQCYKDASALSGTPLSVMFAITLNETGFNKHEVDANDGLDGRIWDCGIMQDNTYYIVCPLANRLVRHMALGYGFGRAHASLINEIKALGLKYVGGGTRNGDCDRLTHAEAVDYCRELNLSPELIGRRYINYGPPLTPDPVCLSVFMGAYELSYDMWWITHDSHEYKRVIKHMKEDSGSAYEYALQHAGNYFPWVLAAYQYNGLVHCHGLKCYFNKFTRHLDEIKSGAVNIIKTYF